MPPLATSFSRQIVLSQELADAGELARAEAPAHSLTRKALHPGRLEYLYELAFLKMFVSWEVFLEEAFLRYRCGYSSHAGRCTLATGQVFASTIADATRLTYGSAPFVLWHNPDKVIKRCRACFAVSPIDTVLSSHRARVDAFAAVRHRIAHGQADARLKFGSATMLLCGRRYPGARAGRFLRDEPPGAPPNSTWLGAIALELEGLARQIA